MNDFDKVAKLITLSDYRSRVEQAIAKAALDIKGENPTAFKPEKAQKRNALADLVLNSPEAYSARFGRAIALTFNWNGQPERNGNITDQQIYDTAAAVWDDIAGITYDEAQPPA